jgi:hypothetical protein
VKSIRSFVGCATSSEITSKTSPSLQLHCSNLPVKILDKLREPYHKAFEKLQRQLGQELILAFPQSNREYLLITNAFEPTHTVPGGLCATLAQKDEKGHTHTSSHMHPGNSKKTRKITPRFSSEHQPQFGVWTISMNI